MKAALDTDDKSVRECADVEDMRAFDARIPSRGCDRRVYPQCRSSSCAVGCDDKRVDRRHG
ncbi:MAG: hypothetical protein ACLSAP_05665 [Oscillospiraceae bacterium]